MSEFESWRRGVLSRSRDSVPPAPAEGMEPGLFRGHGQAGKSQARGIINRQLEK